VRNARLTEFEGTDFLRDGHAGVLKKVRPIFGHLLSRLRLLPEASDLREALPLFADAMGAINAVGDQIETEERETILGAIYDIGAILGLPSTSQFAEEWRGDW
jgi:hypothetical protein